jgi:hypothetical protein
MMRKISAIVLAGCLGGFGFWSDAGGVARAETILGPAHQFGKGTVHTYATLDADGAPVALGIAFGKGALEGLPAHLTQTSRCFDLNQNGQIDEQGECIGDTELNLALPDGLPGHADVPFRFVMLNWNPMGHPPGAWTLPHFDLHFYMIDRDEVRNMRTGPCGILMDCDDFQRAIKPVSARYVHADHVNVEEAVGEMGNHLIDSKTPELGTPPTTFTHTWIFGAYDARIIFYEAMITLDFLLRREDTCAPIKQPAAWQIAGYYPTRYCMRHEAETGTDVVSLEDFVLRPAE